MNPGFGTLDTHGSRAHGCVSACTRVVKCQRVGSNSLDLITGTPLPEMTIMICQLR